MDESSNEEINEFQAKKLLIKLLKSGNKYYKNLINEINIMEKNDFMKLFNGNADYNFTSDKKLDLQRLCFKINKYYLILYEWYTDESKYNYLQDLWNSNIDISNLKYKDKNNISKILENEIPNYNDWDKNIKVSLMNLIKETEINQQEIYEKIRKESEEIGKLMRQISDLKSLFEMDFNKNNIDESFGKMFLKFLEDNSSTTLNNLYDIIREIIKDIKDDKNQSFFEKTKKYKNFYFNLSSLAHFCIFESIKKFKRLEPFKKYIINYLKYYFPYKNIQNNNDDNSNNKNNNDNNSSNEENKNPSDEEYMDLSFNIVNLINVSMRLMTSCEDLENFEKSDVEEKKLSKIIESINDHHDILNGNLSIINFTKAKDIIQAAYQNLKEDENNLIAFMKDIKQKIDKKRKDRNLSICNCFYNALNFLITGYKLLNGDVGVFLTTNAVLSAASTAISGYDIYIQQRHVNLLLDLYKKAENEKEKLLEILEILMKECKKLKNSY